MYEAGLIFLGFTIGLVSAIAAGCCAADQKRKEAETEAVIDKAVSGALDDVVGSMRQTRDDLRALREMTRTCADAVMRHHLGQK